MQRVNNSIELKIAIRQLEIEQNQKKELLKTEFNQAVSQLSPKNIIKNQISQIFNQSNIVETIVDTTIGLATGYISKKIIVGSSNNIFKNILGTLIQAGVTGMVTRNPEKIKDLGQTIYDQFKGKPNETEPAT